EAEGGGGPAESHGLVRVGGDDRLAAPARLVHALRGQRARLDLDEVQVGGGDARVLDGRPHTLRRDARVDRGAELLGKQVARVGGAGGEALLAAWRAAGG